MNIYFKPIITLTNDLLCTAEMRQCSFYAFKQSPCNETVADIGRFCTIKPVIPTYQVDQRQANTVQGFNESSF